MRPNSLRVTGYVGSDEMVGNEVSEKVEPEQGDLREHAALMRNAGCQHVVECGDAIGGNKEQVVAVEIVDVSDFAAGEKFQICVAGFEENGVEDVRAHDVESNREKTVAYSIRASGFVNGFECKRSAGLDAAQRKTVDSSIVSGKRRLWLGLADCGCGKVEEGSGKKGSGFFVRTSRKMLGASRAS